MTWFESNGLIMDRRASLVGDTASAVFSGDRKHRYALTRQWDTSRPMAGWLMLNPSTADAFQSDATIRRCMSFTRRQWGCGGIVVVNLFALRSTDPRALRNHPDPAGPLNDAVIVEQLTGLTTVVAAWGVHGAFRGRGREVTDLLAARGVRLRCLGTTKDGHPKHPLYLPASAMPAEFTYGPLVDEPRRRPVTAWRSL